MNDVVQIISAVGFPIVAALNNNTLVIQKLVDKFDDKGE